MRRLILFLISINLFAQVNGYPPFFPPTNSSGGGGTSGNNITQLVSGCTSEYLTGTLSYTIGACTYIIGGINYSSVLTTVTLGAADVTNPRIDAIVVDNTSSVVVVPGTAATPPATPAIDPSTQVFLLYAYVAANGVVVSNVAQTILFDETGGSEWIPAYTAHFATSTTLPYHLTKDVEATTAVLGNNVNFAKPSSTIDLGTYTSLVIYLRSKAQWPVGSGTGANGLRTLSVQWLNGTTNKGNAVVIKDGQFNFQSGTTNAYQQIVIPVSLFNINGVLVDHLKFIVTGNSGTSSIGFYLDEVSLQNGTNIQSLTSKKDTRCLPIGANNGSALVDADLGPQSRQYLINFSGSLNEIDVAADAGTPSIILGRSRTGTIVNLTSSALATASSGGIACSNFGGLVGIDNTTMCSSTIQNVSLAPGDWITLVSGTAGGTAKEMTACLTFNIN